MESSGRLSLQRILAGTALAFIAVLPQHAAAQQYPDRPLRFIVPFAPGGATDIMARTIAAKVHESWRQPVIVDNRGGGGGTIAAVLAARSAPDGYTWFIGTISTLSTNVASYRKLPYDPLRDFDPVTITAITPFFIVVHPSVPAKTLQELIAAAKAKPGAINYGSSGAGGGAHLVVEYFKMVAGIDLFHVPYKGAGPLTTELLAGQVQLAFSQPPSAVPYARAGKLRALATTALKRVSALPDVPTMAEAGLPGFEANSWQGIVLPRGTPPALIEKILGEVRRILTTDEMRERLAAEGSEAGGIAPAEFRRHMEREIAKWTKVVQAIGLKLD
jgi:tripartite-type tricarboxylate transporter receptor subunit TctC